MNERAQGLLWRWICPWAMVGLGVMVIYVFGWSVLTVSIVALLLACPAIIFWGAIEVKRPQKR